MTTRLEDVPVIKISSTAIHAPVYNRLRLATLRLESPLRLSLTGLRGMDFLMDEAAWICVDRTLYDLPIIAWTNFQTLGRDSLLTPVECHIHYYHIHANVIADTVLTTVDTFLQEQMRPQIQHNCNQIDLCTAIAAKSAANSKSHSK